MFNNNFNNTSIASFGNVIDVPFTPVRSSATYDSVTDKVIIFPTANSLIVPNMPDYITGQRLSTNHYGTVDISSLNGMGPDVVIKAIGADFKAEKRDHYYVDLEGKWVPCKDSILVNNKTGEQIGKNLVSSKYEVLDFDDGVYYFWALLEEIVKHGYQAEPANAKIYGLGGSKMFLQYRIFGNDIMGEPVDTFLTLLTSHDKSMGFTIALSMVRLFCQNQIHRLLKEADQKRVIRHFKDSKEKIQLEANRIIAMCENKNRALESYLTGLANIKVDNEMIFNAMAEHEGLYKMDTQKKVDRFTKGVEQLMACYNMPDLNDWRGTALGAYYAYSDFNDHVQVGGMGKKKSDIRYLENSIDGNVALGNFADILVEMAK